MGSRTEHGRLAERMTSFNPNMTWQKMNDATLAQ